MGRVFITGASGYLGSNLVRAIGKEHDLLLHSRNRALNAAECITCPFDMLEKNLRGFSVDVIVHLAFNKGDSDEAREDNRKTTDIIIRLSQQLNCHIIFISSCAVYGRQTIPCKEDGSVVPLNIYGKSKLEAENMISEKMNSWSILRVFNLYGRNQPNGFFIPDIMEKMIRADDRIVIKNSLNVRDFVHVDFVCDCIRFFIREKAVGIYNIGSGVPHTLVDVANIIKRLLGAQLEIVSDGKKDLDSIADISRINKLGLVNNISLDSAIKDELCVD
ncbi:NAD(P)-dependent oxidoreductase [Candidatus Woesearchaeota archaeon]|nr:NAD(P)-dependent oxidoreductase [Candidatus Woesearchaeota archaeon]